MYTCAKYKNTFILKFTEIIKENLSSIEKIQNECRKKFYIMCIPIYIATILLFLGILFPNTTNSITFWLNVQYIKVITFTIISLSIVLFEYWNKIYQDKIKKICFDKLLKIFGDNIYHKTWAGITDDLEEYYLRPWPYYITESEFDDSDLFDYRVAQRDNDDFIIGEYNGIKFVINEISLSWKGDFNDIPHRMFKGVAIKFNMNKEIRSRVLIFSKSIFNKCPEGYETVNLEYQIFNKKYDVYVEKDNITGQIESRYLLNVAFLERFTQLHMSFKIKKLKCSVYKNNLLVLMDTNRDLFEIGHLFKKIDYVNQYDTLFNEFASIMSFIDVLKLSSRTKI